MSTVVHDALRAALGELRHEPTDKRIRAKLGDHTVVDTVHAVLVWEPHRVVPSWAVPIEDVHADLLAATPADSALSARAAYGAVVDLATADAQLPAAGLRLTDPDLVGYVLLDSNAFDSWWEEDEQALGHPRDPFHRIDILRSSRHVRIERDGQLLAETRRPLLLFETMLPVRFYLPRKDVIAELIPSATRTTCAYKGHASYYSFAVGSRIVPDLAWCYETPQREAADIAGLVAFYNERVDLIVDGTTYERPISPWSSDRQPVRGSQLK